MTACLDRMQFQLNAETWPCGDDEAWPYGDNDRWKEVTPWYLEHFPAEATTAAVPDFHPDAAEMNAF